MNFLKGSQMLMSPTFLTSLTVFHFIYTFKIYLYAEK